MQRHEPEIDVVGWYPDRLHHPIVLDKVACVARESVVAEVRRRATAVVRSQRLFEDAEERKIDRWTLHTNVKEGRCERSRRKEPRDEDVVREIQGARSRKAPSSIKAVQRHQSKSRSVGLWLSMAYCTVRSPKPSEPDRPRCGCSQPWVSQCPSRERSHQQRFNI